MKIQPDHYAKLEAGCTAVLSAHPGVAEQYVQAGLSNMRFNWDVLRAATIDGVNGITWICDNLYPYMNDTHIGTALARIMGNDGTNSKGKK